MVAKPTAKKENAEASRPQTSISYYWLKYQPNVLSPWLQLYRFQCANAWAYSVSLFSSLGIWIKLSA